MSIIDQLRTGDMRTIGNANQIVVQVLAQQRLAGDLVRGLEDEDAGLRMRSADVLEKVTEQKPGLVQPFKDQLLGIAAKTNQQEVQWHLAQIFERLELNHEDKDKLVSILLAYIKTTKSNIVKVFALQTLTTLAQHEVNLKPMVRQTIQETMKEGAPSVVSRGTKLLKLVSG